jgi:hypothetical protein
MSEMTFRMVLRTRGRGTFGILARGFDIEGTDGDDTITGTNAPDRINGRKGNDLVATKESRRWRDGERNVQAMNDVQWRNAA